METIEYRVEKVWHERSHRDYVGQKQWNEAVWGQDL